MKSVTLGSMNQWPEGTSRRRGDCAAAIGSPAPQLYRVSPKRPMDKLDIECIVSGTETDGSVAVFEEIVPPGWGPPRHTHREQLEIFHIIEGKIRFEVSGETFEREAGAAAVVPAGAIHSFRNIGEAPARIHFEMIPALRSEEAFERHSPRISP